jgi:hypothetical protein
VNRKQNTLTFLDNLVLNSMVVKPAVSKENYIPAISGELKATTLTIEDPFTGETLNVKDTLNRKQNKLIAGNNITIDGDTISSSGVGEITQEQLDSIAKLASANTFTANQTISGKFKRH